MDEERGAVAVIFALALVVLLGSVAFVIDLSRLQHTRQTLQNAVDLGALAAAQQLPVQGGPGALDAERIARRIAVANAPSLGGGGLSIRFKCVVADEDANGIPDAGEVPFSCGPATGAWAGGWTSLREKASHLCNPYAGELCNTIQLSSTETIQHFFAPVLGIDTGNTGTVVGVSCRGACGAPSAPLDVAMVFDRTASMTPADIVNAKNAANAVLEFYDPARQWVGLVGLPYHLPVNKCLVNPIQTYPNTNAAAWWLTNGLSRDYKRTDGLLNPVSDLVRTIACLSLPGNVTVTPSGAGHTDLGDPMDAAADLLLRGRADVPDAIIFFTDGEANQPRFNSPCNYLNQKASAAKARGVTIFTIAFGVAGARCTQDTSGPFAGRYASTNLAAAATSSTDDAPGGCGVNENKDGDNYFCESGSADLEPVFRQVASATVKAARLLDDF
jgi:type II secretory pathway pseudopilin PulG